MIVDICPKCGLVKELTKHHIIPERLFTRYRQEVGQRIDRQLFPTIHICRDCHDQLEKEIPHAIPILIDCLNILLRFLGKTLGEIKHLIEGRLDLILDHADWQPWRKRYRSLEPAVV